MSSARRWWRGGLLAALGLVVASPVLTPSSSDGLPLSNYPMFSAARPSTARFPTAVAVEADGTVVRLDPGVVAETDEVVLAAETVRVAIGQGDRASARLCREIADRLAGRALERVELRVETHDVVGWYDGRRQPLAVDVRAECPVRP